MNVKIIAIGPDDLSIYASIPTCFEVDSEFRVSQIDNGLGGIRMEEVPVSPSYRKDYDSLDNTGPESWPETFDIRHWGLFLLLLDEKPIGAAAVAVNTGNVHMLEGRSDLAVLWDIRIHPEHRKQGFGARLFKHTLSWAKEQKCRQMKIETQNINVRACKFYIEQGCQLGSIHRFGYAAVPAVAHETMLLWYIDLH